LLARAQVLRKLAIEADHVIIHTYPWDVVPLIALGGSGGHPPVTLMNKDDHVFWLGASVADQVAQMRGSGSRLSQQRRGIPESRCSLLPIPIEVKARRNSRAEAKRQLGLSEDTVVLLSVATAYKYTASGGDHFAEVLLPIVQEHRNVELIVIGPTEQGVWASASPQAAGRMKVLGKRMDIERFYEAADIYLDSFPGSSLTSFLEAGSYGTPIVSYARNSHDAAVMSGDDPALNGLLVRTSTVDEYRSQISRLVRDEKFRTKLGEATRESILACHTQGGWNRFLEELFLQPGKGSGKEPLDKSRALRNVTELDLQLAQLYKLCGLSSDLPKIIRFHMGFFPFKDRVRFWWGDFGHKWRSLPRSLLADWQKTRLRLLWSRLSKRSA
jgi:glycosyltransferase involved in cell wall biosynthesis